MRNVLIIVTLLVLAAFGISAAQSAAMPLEPGRYEFFCSTGRLRHAFIDGNVNYVRLICTTNGEGVIVPTPTATVVPENTPTPAPESTATPVVMDIDMMWHPSMEHGDRPRHEHGDAPPQWLMDYFGANEIAEVMLFTHPGNTPGETVLNYKHTAFKGWSGNFNGQEWYGVFHLDFQPAGRANRFHSYQLWVKSDNGSVSEIKGWMDFGQGSNTGPNLLPSCGNDSNVRPIMNPTRIGCNIQFESWYARAGGSGDWAPDWGFNVNPNYYFDGDPTNPATWVATGGIRNTNRRIEFAWYLGEAGRNSPRGEFWTTQWGDIVSGENAPVCGTQRSYGDKSYEVLCIRQYVDPTLRPMVFPGNSNQKQFEDNGVQLPN